MFYDPFCTIHILGLILPGRLKAHRMNIESRIKRVLVNLPGLVQSI